MMQQKTLFYRKAFCKGLFYLFKPTAFWGKPNNGKEIFNH
jgi:hypothetical protein